VVYPLEGYRLLDFGTAWAGPQVGQLLADLGMEVIKVETRGKLDGMRMGRPILSHDVAEGDEGKWPDMQPMFHAINRNKLSFTLDLKQPKAKDIIYRLVKISDVVLDNFSPGVTERMGLDHSSLEEIKSDIISISLTGCGESGPMRDAIVYAPIIIALGGLQSLVGYSGEETPMQVMSAYGDANASIHGTFAVLAALWHREKTGEGQHIELSETEAVTSLLGEAIMEYYMNSRILPLQGNCHPTLCPHGMYPCKGKDQWIAIAIDTEEEWKQFCEVICMPHLVNEERFANKHNRLGNREELDRLIAGWTIQYTSYQIMDMLQKAGVAATPALNIEGQYADPHYQHRKSYVEIQHPLVGLEILCANPLRLSETPPGFRRTAPSLGEHNNYVLKELLGLSQDEIAELIEQKIIY
jgi:crotonobetainyl-CoA:carnitine CoA-transferase CaiB-like acyl-CoA transferase